MEAQNKGQTGTHGLSLNNRNILSVDGVTNLESYDQEVILMQTNAGMLEIKGNRLHIQQLNLEQGKVMVEGEINSLIYREDHSGKKGQGFFSKLIK